MDLLKLLTPVLVLLISLAQRRLGDRIGGRLAALPLTSGPLVVLVVCEQGAAAGRAVAEGLLTGAPAGMVFLAGYGWLAPRCRWWQCLPLVTAATLTTGALLAWLHPPAWTSLLALAALLAVAVARWASRVRNSQVLNPGLAGPEPGTRGF